MNIVKFVNLINLSLKFPKKSFGQTKTVQRSFQLQWFKSSTWLHNDDFVIFAFKPITGRTSPVATYTMFYFKRILQLKRRYDCFLET